MQHADELFHNYKSSSDRLNLSDKDLTSNDVTQRVIPFLRANPQIRRVNLSHNLIGDDGAIDLAHYVKLDELDVSNNYIGDMGAIALANCKNIGVLNLGDNHITETGELALNKRYEAFMQMPAEVLGLVLHNLPASEMPNLGLVSKKFYKAANFDIHWKHKYELYFPFLAERVKEPINWKQQFIKEYNRHYPNKGPTKYTAAQRKIVDAIFGNNLAYLKTVNPQELRRTLLGILTDPNIRFNPDNKKLNKYLYNECYALPFRHDGGYYRITKHELLNGAIRCHQPIKIIKSLIEDIKGMSVDIYCLRNAIESGHKAAISFFANYNFPNVNSIFNDSTNILHIVAQYGMKDLYLKYVKLGVDVETVSADRLPFEYFDYDIISQLMRDGHLDYVKDSHTSLEHLLMKIIQADDKEKFEYYFNRFYLFEDRSLSVWAVSQLIEKGYKDQFYIMLDNIDVEQPAIRHKLLLSAVTLHDQEWISTIISMISAYVFSEEEQVAIYVAAINNGNYQILEFIINMNPNLVSRMSSLNISLSEKMMKLHLQNIDHRNMVHMFALQGHLLRHSYKGYVLTQIVEKLHEGERALIRGGAFYKFGSYVKQALVANNTGFIDYLASLDSRYMKRISSYYSIEYNLWSYLGNGLVNEALNQFLSHKNIMREISDPTKIVNRFIDLAQNKQLDICLGTLREIKTQSQYKRILRDSLLYAISKNTDSVARILKYDPPITPAILNAARRQGNPAILVMIKKKMLQDYIKNKDNDMEPDYKPRMRLFNTRNQKRGFSKQAKIQYARHALQKLNDGVPLDSTSKVAKRGELGRIMRRIRRY